MKSVLFKHRSIRKFRPEPIPEEVLAAPQVRSGTLPDGFRRIL